MRWRLKRTARLVLVCATFALCLGATATAQMSQEDSQRTLIGLDMNRTGRGQFQKGRGGNAGGRPKAADDRRVKSKGSPATVN
jgi:hypothetical protein